jgi:hypothetical protein
VKLHSREPRIVPASIILGALILLPAPLLPPHKLAEAVQFLIGMNWKAAYLIAALGLQFAFYCALGVLATLMVKPAPTLKWRLFQFTITPLTIIMLAIVIRFIKVGYPPIWVNAVIPIASCVFGVILGWAFLSHRWKPTLVTVMLVVGIISWALMSSTPARLKRATEAKLQQIVAAGPNISTGDERFGMLLQIAFGSPPGSPIGMSAIQQNRAAILAWGIAVGDPRLARFVGLDPDSELVRRAAELGQFATLRGRGDWPKHYAVSAALAVLEHPLISDAQGLMKEQLDALARGSGFSFGDLTADRAGVRFASAATSSESMAKAMQMRLQTGFALDDFFPTTVDFPENLTVEEFRRSFGGVGSQRYRNEIKIIEAQLDTCKAIPAR